MKEMLSKDIFYATKPCFQSITNHAKIKVLSKGIACVALGLRVSHLIDIAHLNLDQAQQLSRNLQKIPMCRETILLVQFKDRFTFVCNKKRMKEHYEETMLLHPHALTFIAVEGKEPVQHKEAPAHVVHWLSQKLYPQLTKEVCYFDKVPPFMVALNGWFLEYPVIYTTHSIHDDPEGELDEWEVKPNCLGGRTLHVIRPCIQDIVFFDDDHSSNEDALFSFSCPEGTLDRQHLELMKQNLKLKIDQRLDDLDRLSKDVVKRNSNNHNKKWTCQIQVENVSLDRFAL
ncbi:hypothetical protein BDF20DRAFT_843499 [Mycotypha africana]|uniref:uncharacterized protein n=1 Tax=Mycotypha africana TaxID=64632 RepID=UPI0023015BBB|nr:uncharacterized protein BDF20DRAFT_843499 [Mycotypha africana]KAI8991236.1 hypothetical protein BDF20DRAFT_843499 [Mycotypha africana]